MAVEALSSNVVNYLVWRYLQEAGYGNAALHLARCWNRDPDSLPFSRTVQPHTLINLLQDGLWFDKLQAEASNDEQRYTFGRDHGRPYSVRNGTQLTLDRGIPAHELVEDTDDAVQETVPKRGIKRKKAKPNGVVETRTAEHVNGDTMDIEPNGTTHVTNSVRAESEALMSDAESPSVVDIPISTLSIGHSAEIQTEPIVDLAPGTVFIDSKRNSRRILQHTSWHPSQSAVLLTAGSSLLEVHSLSPDNSSSPRAESLPLHLPLDEYSVTALAWTLRDEVLVSARAHATDSAEDSVPTDHILKLSSDGMHCELFTESAGLVSTLRVNQFTGMLLSISAEGDGGTMSVWDIMDGSMPTWEASTATAILDALWIRYDAFAVCGIDLLQIYSYVGDEIQMTKEFSVGNVSWESLKYDASSQTLAVLGIGTQTSAGAFAFVRMTEPMSIKVEQYPDAHPTDLDLRLRSRASLENHGPDEIEKSALLATSSMSGVVRLWECDGDVRCLKQLPTTDGTQAFKVAFSPGGSLLAAAGPDAVTIWDVDKGAPLASWRADDLSNERWNPSVDGEFTMGWNAEGSRLSIALGNQIAIVSVPR